MKKGISLIAVLMFMLAATTASVVVYKWIGSENFASGSRLKQSEAYQASEAGLDAVHAWLSYKAPDVGAVVKDFYSPANNKKPYNLTNDNNNVLGQLKSSNLNFKVHLISVDTSNIRKIKLKFQSIGEGRDGSKVQQTAIYSVNGLYKLIMTGSETRTSQCSDYDEDFWGNMGTVGFLEAAKAVVTQTPEIKNAGGQALNTVKIGTIGNPGYLVLDGNYYANNGINVEGDVYSTGNFDFCGSASDRINGNLYVDSVFHPKAAMTITGDAYLRGGVDPTKNINVAGGGTGGCSGQASGGTVSIGGNSTIKGNFVYWNNNNGGGLGFHVARHLVMDNGVITLTRTGSNPTDSLAAYGNVYIKNALTGTIPNADTRPIPFFGNNTNDTVCVPGMSLTTAGTPSYWKNAANIQMRTKASKVESSCTPKDHWNANKLDYLKSKLSDDPAKKSCQNPPIQFDATIYDTVKIANAKDWVHRKDKPGSCATTARCAWDGPFCDGSTSAKFLELAFPSYPPRDIGGDLQDCYNDTKNKPTERYLSNGPNSGWLVVYIKDSPTSTNQDIKMNASKWGGNPNPSTITSGKYIIILELSQCNNGGQQCFLYLPPTAPGVEIMLYLPKGFPGRIELAGTPKGKTCSSDNKCDDYNYFIFSDGDINQFDATSKRKLHGNIFMNKCAVMNHVGAEGNAYLTSESNSEFVKELMEQGVLCMFEERGENCIDPNAVGCKPPPSSVPPIRDNFFVPISPRLRVELESKYISKEIVSGNKIDHSVLVMPRIIRFKKADKPSIASLQNYYNFLYLNYPSNETKPTFGPPANCGTYNPAAPDDGIYECVFTNTKISPFYLQIHSGAISEGGYASGGGGGSGSGPSSPSGSSSSRVSSSSSRASSSSSTGPGGPGGSSSSYITWCRIPGGCYDYPVPAPEYGCMPGRSDNATGAKFKYTYWNTNSKAISRTDVKWNRSPPEAQSFNSKGKDRDVYMYQIRCDGDRIDLGNDISLTDSIGVYCGTIDITNNCDYTPWCRITQTCFTGTSVPASAIEYGCGYGVATVTNDSSFRYTAANGGDVSSSNATSWASGGSQSVSARTNAKIYMYRINCDGNSVIYGTPGDKGGILCDGSLTTGATTCPSSSSASSSSRASSSSVVPSSSSAACAYQVSWCNNLYNRYNIVPTTATGSGESCFFVRDVSKLQTNKSKINGVVPSNNNDNYFACGQWGKESCASLLPPKQDGGYYIYTGDWISSYDFTTGSPVCGGGSTPTVSSSSSVPSSSSSSLSGTSITCAFAKGSYAINENIAAPTITCSNGTLDKNNANFSFTPSSFAPANSGNWRNQNGTTSYTSTGTSTVKISNVKCGNVTAPEATCTPTLTITSNAAVTCTATNLGPHSGCKYIDRPTVSCGAGISVSNTSFDYGGTETSAGSSVFEGNNSSSQQFCSTTGSNGKAIYLKSVTCGSNTLTNRVHCGTVIIN